MKGRAKPTQDELDTLAHTMARKFDAMARKFALTYSLTERLGCKFPHCACQRPAENCDHLSPPDPA